MPPDTGFWVCGHHIFLFLPLSSVKCCNLLLVENMKDPLCFKVSDQTIPKQQHIVQVTSNGYIVTVLCLKFVIGCELLLESKTKKCYFYLPVG